MSRLTSIRFIAGTALCGALFSLPAISHFDDQQIQQSYRQSYFALVAANFGPMVSSIKGEIPWDQARMENLSNDLAALSTLDIMRGFTDGSDKGTTRAKPEIWQNKDDFTAKMDDLDEALLALQTATATGDREAIGKQIGAAGKACKACHDEYKAKNYLY